MSDLCDPFFNFIFIFIMINRIIDLGLFMSYLCDLFYFYGANKKDIFY